MAVIIKEKLMPIRWFNFENYVLHILGKDEVTWFEVLNPTDKKAARIKYHDRELGIRLVEWPLHHPEVRASYGWGGPSEILDL